MFLCQKLKSSLPRVGRVARSAGRVFFFYPLRPRKHRSRPPTLWGQLETYVRKQKKKYVFMFLCQNQNKIMSLCSKTKTTKKRHYIT